MTTRSDDVEALAQAVDRVVFPEARLAGGGVASQGEGAIVSYLNDSFPRMAVPPGRRDRLQRRMMRALGIPRDPSPAGWIRLEAEMNRRLGNLDPRLGPVVGGAAIVLLGVVGFAVWRQRGAVKPAAAFR
jgi:hypothetical protein